MDINQPKFKSAQVTPPAVGSAQTAALPEPQVTMQPSLPPDHNKKGLAWWALIVCAVMITLGGIGYAATKTLTSDSSTAKATPQPSVQPAVSGSERSNIKTDTESKSRSQLDVDGLDATQGNIDTLLVKALQVSGGITIQGDVTASGNATFGGTVRAANISGTILSGNGAAVTGVNAATLGGQTRAYYEAIAGVGSANAALRTTANTFAANNTFASNVTVNGATTLGATSISSLALGAPLTAAQGGTGLTSVPALGLVYSQGGPTMAVATPSGSGLCLISGSTDLQWGSCSSAAAGVATLNGLTGAVTISGATAAGTVITLADATTAAKGVASFNATNFSVSGGAVNIVQNINVTATPTFAGLTLSAALAVGSGGTGSATLASGGVVIGNGAGALSAVAAGSAGLCLISTSGTPSWQACPGGGAVTSISGQSGAVTITGATGSGGVITVQDASTAQKGLAQFDATNFTVSGGTANTIQNIATSASPTFAGLNTNTITPSAALTIGATTQNATLQGANTTVTQTNGANLAQLTFVAPTANVVYRLQTAAAGTYDVCTTAGNCVGTGGSVSTSGGSAGTIPKYTSATALGPSLLADNGTLVTVGGNLSVTGTVSFTSALSIANGGTGATTAAASRNGLGAAASGANSDITSLAGLTTAVSIVQGGTGATSLTANGVLLGNGTGPISSLVAGSAGQCLISNAGAPSWQTCPGSGGGGVTTLNTLSGALTLANASAAGATVTIDNATTAAKGIASFSSTNFTVTAGAVNTIQNIATTASPTFAGLNTNTITPSSALTVGAITQNTTLQGANTTITATNGVNTAMLTYVTPTANVTYRLQTAAAGTYDVCTTAGNCVGAGGSVSTSGGTAGVIPKYTSASALGASLLSDNGTLVTVGGNLSVTGTVALTTALSVVNGGTGATTAAGARTGLGAAASGANSDITSLAGLTTALSIVQGGSGATSLTTNGILLGNGTSPISSLVAGSAGLCLVSNAGAPSWQSCPGGGGGVTSIDSLTGALTFANTSGVGSTVTIDNATTAAKGIASFNSTNFTASSGAINTIQNIATSSSPTFAGVNTNAITPSAALTVGSTSQTVTIQGNGSSVFTATASGNTSTIGFTTPTANSTINFPASAAGTYTICTTAGNCSGSGGGVTTAGGTSGKLARFSGAQTLVDSIISDSGTIVTVAGGQIVQGSTGLSLGVASTTNGKIVFNNSTNANTTTLQSGAAGSNLAFTLPVADGASGQCLTTDGGGALAFAACLSGSGGGSGGVNSVNGLSGALTVANASGSGSTITIQDASTAQKGIAQFNTTNFQAASGTINTIQDIATSSSPSFAALAITSTTGLTIGSGSVLGQMALRDGSSAFSVKFQPSTQTANHTIAVPNAAGTIAVSASGNIALDAAGNLTFTGSLPVANGGTGSTTAGGARTNLGAAASGANSDITSLTGLSTALSVVQGGTGAATLASNGVILGNGTSPLSSLVAGSAGLCLISNAGAPTWQTCTGAGGVSSFDGLTGALSLANSSGSGATVTIDNASTSAKGIASFNSTNFSVSSGAVNTIQNINTSASPTFAALTASSLSSTGTLTIGTSSQPLALQGSASSSFAITGGGFLTTLGFAGTPTGSQNYNFDRTAAAGTYTVCTTANNCVGTGGSVSTSGGSAGVIPKYTSASALGASLLTDNGTLVTVGGNLSVTGTVALTSALTVANGGTGSTTAAGARTNLGAAGSGANADISSTTALNTITPSAALTIGATSQSFTVQGNGSSIFSATSSGNTTTVGFATPTANTTLNFPASATGTYTVCTTAGNCAGSGGGVTTAGGTSGKIAKFNGAQSLADSIITDSGTAVTIAGGALVQGSAGLSLGLSSSVNGKLVFNNSTNANTTTLQSGAAGSNLTFTLPTADGSAGNCLTTNASGVLSFANCLSGASGGSGGVVSLNSLSGSLTVANATTAGSTITIQDASTTQKGIAQFNTTNFQAASGTINTIQDIATGSSPSFAALSITSTSGVTVGTGANLGQLGLRDGSSAFTVKFQPATLTANRTITVPNAAGTVAVSASGNVALDAAGNLTFAGTLPVSSGGTGATSITANGLVLGNGTSAVTTVPVGSTGQCLLGNTGAAPSFGTCGGGGGVTSLNSQTGAVSLANSSGSAGTVTIDDASTAAKGIASFNSTNFSVTSGAVNTVQGISTTAAPTFNALTLTGTNALALGTGSTNAGSVKFYNASNANTTTLQSGVAASSYTITLPTAAPGTSQCLGTDSVTASQLVFSTCGSGVTTVGNFSASSQTNGASISGSTITFGPADGTNPGLVSTGTQSLAGQKTWTGNSIYTGTILQKSDSSSAFILQDSTGTYNNLAFDSSTGHLKVYDHSAPRTAYADIYYASGTAVFAASTGLTQIGAGTGDVTVALTNNAEKFNFTHTGTAASNTDDFVIQRNITGGSTALSGNILRVEDLSTTTGTKTANLLYINQSVVGTGNLILAQTGGATTKFAVSPAGVVSIASGQSITGLGALTVDSASATALNFGTTNASTITIGNTANNPGINLNSGTGTISIGTGAQARTTNIATGAAVQAVTVGSTNTTSSLTLQSGTGGLSLQSTTGTISLGTSASARTVSLATGAAAQAVTLGSTNTTSSLTLQSGTGALALSSQGTINIGTNAIAQTITIGSTTAGGTLRLGQNVGNLQIDGPNFDLATTGLVTMLGGLTTDLTTSVSASTGQNFTLQPGTSTGASINGGATTIKGGDASGTTAVTGGALVLQAGSATGASGTRNGGSLTIDAGTGATVNGTVSIATANAGAVTIGVTATNNQTTINGLTLIKPNTADSATAFAVQNAGAVSQFNVDTTNARITVGPIAGDTVGTLLVFGNKTTSGDPTGVEGSMYYNSSTKAFRCYTSGAWRGCGGGVVFANTSVPGGNTVANTTAETNFASNYTIPANDCQPGKVYKVSAFGLYSTAGSAPSLNLKLKAGATVLSQTNAINKNSSQTNQTWNVQGLLTCDTAGSTGTVEANGQAFFDGGATLTDHYNGMGNAAAVTLDTTTTQTLQLSATWGAASASNSIVLRQIVIEAQ